MPVPTLSSHSAVHVPPDIGPTAAVAITVAALRVAAARLRAAWSAGTAGRPLAGKNLAVLQSVGGGEVSALQRAAVDLGARVAQVSLGEPPPEFDELAHIARMLGRMYDAIDATGTPPLAAAELAKHAGVPVYRCPGGDGHPLLLPLLPVAPATLHTETDADADERRFLMQALLIRTLT